MKTILNRRTLTPALLATGLALGLTSHASALPIIYDAQGFEPLDDYTLLNPLAGEDPDDDNEPDFQEGPWQKSLDTTANVTATIQSIALAPRLGGGLQLVQMNRTGANGRGFWGVQKTVQDMDLLDPLVVQWSMNVTDASDDPNAVGPFFGLDVNDALDNSTGFPLLAASAGLDAATGELVTFDQSLAEDRKGIFYTLGQWHDFMMVLDYVDQTFDVFVDGSLAIDDQAFIDEFAGPVKPLDFTDFAFSTFALDTSSGGQFTPTNATAYYDSVLVAVPEPSTALIAATLGPLMMLARRRRRFAS